MWLSTRKIFLGSTLFLFFFYFSQFRRKDFTRQWRMFGGHGYRVEKREREKVLCPDFALKTNEGEMNYTGWKQVTNNCARISFLCRLSLALLQRKSKKIKSFLLHFFPLLCPPRRALFVYILFSILWCSSIVYHSFKTSSSFFQPHPLPSTSFVLFFFGIQILHLFRFANIFDKSFWNFFQGAGSVEWGCKKWWRKKCANMKMQASGEKVAIQF